MRSEPAKRKFLTRIYLVCETFRLLIDLWYAKLSWFVNWKKFQVSSPSFNTYPHIFVCVCFVDLTAFSSGPNQFTLWKGKREKYTTIIRFDDERRGRYILIDGCFLMHFYWKSYDKLNTLSFSSLHMHVFMHMYV